MKVVLIIFYIYSFFGGVVPPEGDEIQKISQAIKAADAEKLAVYFSTTIELELGEISGSYSKTQAELIMRDFFKNSPLVSYTLNHQGSSDDGSKYSIGTYKTKTKEYRVYILLKKQGSSLLIQQLQFE